MARNIEPNRVAAFIRRKLRDELQRDFNGRPFLIYRERDLHSCCYYHLRRYLKGDHSWEILNEPSLRNLKGRGKIARPDIVLFRNDKPVYIIELKFRRHLMGIQRKDQRVLRNAVKSKKWAKKAYYIEAIIDPEKHTGRDVVPYRNRTITLKMREDRIKEYNGRFKERRKPKPRLYKHK